MRRWFFGSACKSALSDTLAAMGTVEAPAEPMRGWPSLSGRGSEAKIYQAGDKNRLGGVEESFRLHR